MNQLNPYIQMSNASTPPLSQTSSLPLQMGTVANQMVSTECMHNMNRALNTINNGMSALNLIQPSVYAISSNSSQPSMACVQNVHLKADNSIDYNSDNNHMLSSAQNPVPTQQMVELVPVWPQRVPNIQTPNNTALNRFQYYSPKGQQNNTNDSAQAVKDRADRRNNSSFNASHYRKSVNNSINRSTKQNNSYGQQNRNSTAAENECQTGHNSHDSSAGAHRSTPNTSALQGLPFVKHYSNNRFHTLPVSQTVLNSYQSSVQQPKYNNSPGSQPLVTKMVNGVQIYALANYSSGDVDGYGYASNTLTPPLTPGNHQNIGKSVHK